MSPSRGRLVERCESIGKHLLIWLSGDLALRTHMRMSGSWHLYRPGEAWQRASARDAGASGHRALGGGRVQRAGRGVPDEPRHPANPGIGFAWTRSARRQLRPSGGPSAAAPGWRAADCRRPARSAGSCRHRQCLQERDPVPVRHPSGAIRQRHRQRRTRGHPRHGIPLMRANIGPGRGRGNRHLSAHCGGRPGRRGPRTTCGSTGGPARRAGRCGTAIEVARRGADARATYWCPRCQDKDRGIL